VNQCSLAALPEPWLSFSGTVALLYRNGGPIWSGIFKEAAKKVEDSINETPTCMEFPYAHWSKLRSNNVIERLNREIRRRTRVVGTFPDGSSALMLVCARLRHVASKAWGTKRYMSMTHLEEMQKEAANQIAG